MSAFVVVDLESTSREKERAAARPPVAVGTMADDGMPF